MSASASGRRRRHRLKMASRTAKTPPTEPMEFVGFEGSRHLVPERLPSARKEKTVGIRVIDLNKGAMENIKELGPNLRRLDLSDLRLAKLNEEFLACLKYLEKLDLENNELTEDSFPIAFTKVDRLVELCLEHNKLAAFPRIIRKLKELRRLKLGSNRLVTIDGVERLKRLQILMLDNNQLETLPREVFQNLKKLEILHLANNRIKEIHTDIKFLRYLKDVNFSGNRLKTLPTDLLKLPRLEVLNASGNRISRVPTINVKGRGNRKMASVDLSSNVLLKFPEHLLAMSEKLDLCKNRIRSIPASVLKKADSCSLQEVLISENPLVSPPLDICECGLRSIVQYFQEAKAETKVYQGLKVLVLGGSGCGKTSLVQTLLDQQPRLTPQGQATVGIDMYNLDYDIEIVETVLEDVSASSDDSDDEEEEGATTRSHAIRNQPPKIPLKSLQFCVWDFAGHEQYLQSHYYFLHDPALVLLVFNMAEYEEEGFRKQIGFWVEYVLSRTHKIVLMPVGTKADLVSPERASEICSSVHRQIKDFVRMLKKSVETEIQSIEQLAHIPYTLSEQLKQYLRLMKAEVLLSDEVLGVSCEEYTGIDSLLTAMKDMALDKELFPNVMRVIPSRWCEVEDYVEEKAWSMDLPFMHWEAYCEEVTKRYGMKHLMVPITQYLHDVGKVIWYSNHSRLKEFVFLRPSWLADVMKHVFRHDVAEIDFNIEENFKQSGLSLDKFNKLTRAIIEEGQVERDFLKGAWSGLLPPDSNKAVIEVIVILLEYFELGYPVVKPGSKEVRISLTPSIDNLRPLESSESMSSLMSTRVEDLQQESAESLNQAKSKPAGKRKVKKDEPPPVPKINRITVPFMRRVAKSKQAEQDVYLYRYNLSVTSVYKFPHFCPPGFFETMCVRALKPSHNCKVLHDWEGGLYVRCQDKPYTLLLEKIESDEHPSVCIRVEVRHMDSDAEESEVEQMWGVLLPYLKDVEDLLEKFLGVHVKRFMQCPKCGSLDGFIGEWLSPKELQSLPHKTCTQCEEGVSTQYLIQPKEKKRVEEFLLRKLKREAEKRQSNMTMEHIEEEPTNEKQAFEKQPANEKQAFEKQPANQSGSNLTLPEFKHQRPPINGHETNNSGHMTYSNKLPNGDTHDYHGDEQVTNGDGLMHAGDFKEKTKLENGHQMRGANKGSAHQNKNDSTKAVSRRGSPEDTQPVVRPKSRQSPPAGKYLVRDLEEQKYLVDLPSLRPGKGVEKNLQTD